ncbi:TIGR04211 family SH3 domain-containing protein [uncultured Desulfuromonas sp.]|uniref:TIGR04211 family SH3 domain-containing protein n=1 Tax=uncultured Desulfuromonas sp. TaxID=181013 RepID=UPI00260E8FEF|nr:TIGR04211 family SH3 domain-containing protein [uncultured Desulfuromonas sp.]
MNYLLGLCCLLVCVFAAPAVPAAADTLYVSDQLVITLRQGKGTQYKILKSLKTGDPVEVLEEGERYLKVRARGGEEGYVLKQYLSRETPKTKVISRLEKEQQRLKDELAKARQRGDELTAQSRDSGARAKGLEQSLGQKEKDLGTLREQFEALQRKSADVVRISEERDSLETENTRLQVEAQSLRSENETLLRTGMIKWFLAGGGVFFIGWVVGKVSRKKRRGSFS